MYLSEFNRSLSHLEQQTIVRLARRTVIHVRAFENAQNGEIIRYLSKFYVFLRSQILILIEMKSDCDHATPYSIHQRRINLCHLHAHFGRIEDCLD